MIYCNVRFSESIRQVFLSLYRELCNVKFSNIDYRKITLFDLTRVVNYRLGIGEECLLCIDNCENLSRSQLQYFTQFLSDFDKPIGLVFRMNDRYIKKLTRNYRDQYDQLIKVVDNWRVLESPSINEVQSIARAFDISDPMILSDLVNSSGCNLTILKKEIDRYVKLKAQRNLEI